MKWHALIRECLAAKERVTVHFWWDRREWSWLIRKPEPLPSEHSIFLVEAGKPLAPSWYVDVHRIFRLPIQRACDLYANAGDPADRDEYQTLGTLRRALVGHRDRFGFYAYDTSPMSWESLERAQSTAIKLADVSTEVPSDPAYGPWCADYGVGKERDPNDPAYHATLEQLGMRADNDNGGRMTVLPIDSIENCKIRLLALEPGDPTYVNSVPVKRIPCTPIRFEVGFYELTAEAGLGTGGRIRRTKILTLSEAAERVQTGYFPHFKYLRTQDRWMETQ